MSRMSRSEGESRSAQRGGSSMTREHVVETLEWEMGFRSEEEAFEWQPRLQRLIRGTAVDVIESVFDELSAEGEVLVLDSLSLDLGMLGAEGFEASLSERLRASLREALLHELAAQRAGAESAATRVTREASEEQTLRHYLAKGFLPWRAGAQTAKRLDDLAVRIARQSGPGVAEWLRTMQPHAGERMRRLLHGEIARLRLTLEAALVSDAPVDAAVRQAWSQLVRWDADWLVAQLHQRGQSAQARQRMAWAFSQEMLLELVGLVVPGERDFVEDVMGQGALFAQAQDPPVPQGDLRPRLWEFTLTYLLVERGSDFNRRSYMGSLLRQAARHEGMDYAQMLRAMARALRRVAAPTGLQRQLLQLLGELVDDDERQAPRQSSDEQASLRIIALHDRYGEADEEAARRALAAPRLRLETALLTDSPVDAALRQAWTALVRWDPDWLVEQVRHHGQTAQVRQRMARGFAQEMLLELVGLLVPTERGFVHEVVNQSALFARARDLAQDAAPAPGDLGAQLWEFTLAYLLVERGSDFNRRSYMGSLLRQAARHEGLAYGDMLHAMMRALREVAAPSGLQRQMLQLLEGLAHDSEAPSEAGEERTAGTAPGSARWLQRELPELRFRWRAALAAGDLRGVDIHAAWHQLVRHDTHWLLEQTQHAAQGEQLRGRMAQGLPQQTLLELVELLAPGERDFVEAAVTQSELVHRSHAPSGARDVRAQLWEFTLTYLLVERGSEFNRRSYLGSMLRQMARREGLQASELLAALAASLRALGTASALQRQMLRLTLDLLGEGTESGGVQAARERQAARVTRALQDGESLSPMQSAQLVRDVQHLLELGDSAVRALLERALRSPGAAARLAALLPPRLLTRVVWLMRREHHHVLQRGADLIVDAAIAAGTQAPHARVHALKWQFILRYLFVEGREFTLHDFARRFTDWLAGQLRVPQPAQWRATVAAQVTRDKRSAGQALGRAVAAALTASQRPVLSPSNGPEPKPAPPQRSPAPKSTWQEPAQGEPIYIANAGLVLCEPYLPRLFAVRGLTEGGAFKGATAIDKAVQLLQYTVTGRCGGPEHQLVLDKLLCGLAIEAPVNCDAELDDEDRSTVESMLKAMLANWKALGGTSVAGLRETFLQRQGRLVLKGDHWQLLVDPGPFDMLIDQLPWGFSTLKYPWMERMIHVQWR
jgi:hypothetical protein